MRKWFNPCWASVFAGGALGALSGAGVIQLTTLGALAYALVVSTAIVIVTFRLDRNHER